MTGIIRRIDDLGRIVIPKEIRDYMNVTEGTQFEIVQVYKDTIAFKKINNEENLKKSIINLQDYLKEKDVCDDIGKDNADKINKKLNEICEIIKFRKKE